MGLGERSPNIIMKLKSESSMIFVNTVTAYNESDVKQKFNLGRIEFLDFGCDVIRDLPFNGSGGDALDQGALHKEIEGQQWDRHHGGHGHHIVKFGRLFRKTLFEEFKRHD